jgi:hypothetical protein
MSFREIQVECYAGGRADERPRRVIIDERTHIVARLLSESLDEGLPSANQSRRFRLLTDEGVLLEVIRSGDGAWYLSSEPPETRA